MIQATMKQQKDLERIQSFQTLLRLAVKLKTDAK
jgi:hypothetical protein